jgi:DNA-binding NarL/FixJ family response regulator
MERLAAADVAALLAFVSELEALDDPHAFPPRVLLGLQRLIPADEVAYSELNPATETSILQIWLADGVEAVVVGADEDYLRTHELWWQLRPTHPVCGYRGRSGNWTEPLRASDFAPLREFRKTPIYDAFYRGELDYWLDMGLPATATKTRVFIFLRRGGRDFTERDKMILELLRPHLEARAAAAKAAADAAAALAMLEEPGSEEAHRVVLCSAGGAIEFASPASRALLRRYLGIENGRLPAALLNRRTVVLANGNGRLTIRTAPSGGLRVLLLEERDERLDRLTSREREILDRVGRGRTNAEIGSELEIATATVAKHLEHVYEKLGVRSRAAAAVLLPLLAAAC